jgi:hypothetical protein
MHKNALHYQQNKEIIVQKVKIYRDKNKDLIAIKNKQKYICVCGSSICNSEKLRHEKTKKH